MSRNHHPTVSWARQMWRGRGAGHLSTAVYISSHNPIMFNHNQSQSQLAGVQSHDNHSGLSFERCSRCCWEHSHQKNRHPRGSPGYCWRRRRILLESTLGTFRDVTQPYTVNRIQETAEHSQFNHAQSQSQLNMFNHSGLSPEYC